MCTLECFGPCCGCFSIAGIIFLVIMGIIVNSQPEFLKEIEDPGKSAAACFGGAGIYAATFALSMAAIVYDRKKKQRRRALEGGSGKDNELASLTAGAAQSQPGTYDARDGTQTGTELTKVPAPAAGGGSQTRL